MDQQLKQRLIMAALGFNATLIFFQIGFNSGLFGFPFSILKTIIGIVIALVVGGGAFVATQMSQK